MARHTRSKGRNYTQLFPETKCLPQLKKRYNAQRSPYASGTKGTALQGKHLLDTPRALWGNPKLWGAKQLVSDKPQSEVADE